MGNNCSCNEKKEIYEKEIYNEEDIKKMTETFNRNDNLDTPYNSNLNEESLNKINSNEKTNEINQYYLKKYGIDLTEPLVEKFEYEEIISNNENENTNLKTKKNLNTTNSNKTNSNKLNSETDGGIYTPNTLNNNTIQQLKKKDVNQNTLRLFNISKKNTFNKSIKKKNNNNNNINNIKNSNIRKVQTQYSHPNNLSKVNIIEGINNLNEIFLNEKNNINNGINNEWKNIDINTIISQPKLNSIDPDEILFNSNLYKLVLSSLFKICSMNIEQFVILIKDKILIYQNKENFLLMKKPQREFDLINIESCDRIDLCSLNFHYLQGYYYMYIEIKDDNIYDDPNNENDLIYKIIQKERQGNFYVFFSKDELLINQWVCAINCFIKPNYQKTTEKQ